MIDFDDTLGDELGEDFGFLNTPAFTKSKWRELRLQWDSLVAPYREIGRGNIPPPNYLKTQYAIWKAAYNENAQGWLAWTSSISIWKSEAQRYKNVYEYLQNLRTANSRTPNANLSLTPSPTESGAAPPIDVDPPSSKNEGESGKAKWYDPATWELNFGQVALLGLGTFVAYNVFFRLREGRRRI